MAPRRPRAPSRSVAASVRSMAARYCSSVCGRYTLAAPAETVAEAFGIEAVPGLAPRYNIAPTEPVPVVRAAERGRVLEMRRWGLVPHWAREPGGPPLFNARAETVAGKPAFREPFRLRRGLAPADGFYEWREAAGRRQPWHVRRRDGGLFAIAALWETWKPPDGETLASCTFLTTEANDAVRPIHDRMPVILPPERWDAWLDPGERDPGRLGALLVPADPALFTAYPVDPRVNRAEHDEPANVEPLFDDLA